jgi:hypothetical protein
MPAPAPEQALDTLVETLRNDDSVISQRVHDTQDSPALGLLAAAGPRTAAARGDYALLVESVREGYLLHYGSPRVVDASDRDLALLAGDYLYARGLERLAALGDLDAVRELSDLISLSAQVHAGGNGAGSEPLWLATVVAVAAGGGERHEGAKAALREERAEAPQALLDSARSAATSAGIVVALTAAADSVGLAVPEDPSGIG